MNKIVPVDMPDSIELRDEERQPCEVWTRVMGYHRPVSSFNRGKQGEFHERVYFSEARAWSHGELSRN
jgi:hypothetical protein